MGHVLAFCLIGVASARFGYPQISFQPWFVTRSLIVQQLFTVASKQPICSDYALSVDKLQMKDCTFNYKGNLSTRHASVTIRKKDTDMIRFQV